MTDAFMTEPAGGVGRARLARARAPLLDQEFDAGNLYTLRAAVQAHASQAGLSEERADEVVLAVHELAANAIAHGAGHGRLRMWNLADALSFEVVDDGPADGGPVDGGPTGADAAAGPAGAGAAAGHAGADAAGRPAGAGAAAGPAEADGHSAVADPWPSADGHGLWLVRQVADQLGVWSGLRGTRAVVTFALPKDQTRLHGRSP